MVEPEQFSGVGEDLELALFERADKQDLLFECYDMLKRNGFKARRCDTVAFALSCLR